MDLMPALTKVVGARAASAELQKLKGDASTRSYYRVRAPGGSPSAVIVMRLPADAMAGNEGSSAPAPTELPFVAVHRMLEARGVCVPRILAQDIRRGLLLLEDLGDETFEARLRARPSDWEALYSAAVDALVDLHKRCAQPNDCLCYARSFDRALLRWELDHFRQWGLEENGRPLSERELGEFDRCFVGLTEALLELPQGFVHRDFQSRNLMWAPDGRLVIIDFQDALLGPQVYDLVALLCDSYVTLPLGLQLSMVERYAAGMGLGMEATQRAFWLTAAHRKLKDSGRFVFIDQVRGNPDFLPWYAPSLVHVGRAVEQCGELSELGALLERTVDGFPDAARQPARRTGQRVEAE